MSDKKTIRLVREVNSGNQQIKNELVIMDYSWADDAELVSKLFQLDGANSLSAEGPITSYASLSNSMIREREEAIKVKTSENGAFLDTDASTMLPEVAG